MVPTHGSFIALITAMDPEAPPILQWDREGKRNPVSWYVYNGGSPARRWNLESSTWVSVTAITGLPSAWDAENPLRHQGDGAILLLEGARDTTHTRSGGFFTESLRSEYHAIRRTLEAYMLLATIAGKDEATACGYDLRKGGLMNASVRVTSGSRLRQQYLIDRWD